MEFKNGKLTVILHAQSPMIHFQYDQTGATLRASEVKPKLDRYLLSQISEQDESWFIGESKTALNYKLRIEALIHEKVCFKDRTRRGDWKFPLYYGDIGQNEEFGTFVFSDVYLTISCYQKDLQQAITNHLENFFICHNFGTMQGKGFGSFVINKQVSETSVVRALKSVGAVGEIYKFDCVSKLENITEAKSYQLIFEQIQTFYKLTKSGINQKKSVKDKESGKKILLDKGYARSALFLYMHKKHSFGNEKAMIKANDLVDYKARSNRNSSHEHQNYSDDHPHHYVRALLGMSSTMFKLPSRWNNPSDYVKIQSKQIKRFSSPLRFKVVNRIIYIYVVRDEGILGKSFKFISKNYNHKSERITTPNSFDISDFLAFATWYYNTCLEKLTSSLPEERENWKNRLKDDDKLEDIDYPSENQETKFNVKLVVNKLPEELHDKQKILLVDKGDQDDTTLPGLDHRANL